VSYEVVLRDETRRAFLRLDKGVQKQVQRAIDRLAENPRPGQATQLVGDADTWRVRAGDWRILYEILDEKLTVRVLDIAHRREAYGGH
jgi:mRNA interferase RelE/StbE